MPPTTLTYTNPRYDNLASTPQGVAIWKFLTSESSIALLESGARQSRSSILELENELIDLFHKLAIDPQQIEEYKSMLLNMSRVLMEQRGWEHIACQLSPGHFFTSSGMFGRKENANFES